MNISQLKKLAARVNYRIKSMEQLTGEKNTFSVKYLIDKLDANTLNAITPSGRVSIKKGYSDLQQKAIGKAMNEFLSKNSISSVKQIKEYTQRISNLIGHDVTYTQASSFFQARKNYTWIYEYMTPSDFWTLVRTAREENWDVQQFTDILMTFINDRVLDEELRKDIEDLYDYAVRGV